VDIVSFLDALTELLLGLSVTDPAASSIKRVWTFPPPRGSAMPDKPCWLLSWTLNGVGAEQEGASFDEFIDGAEPSQSYTVRMQLFLDEEDLNVGAQIATAYLPKLIAAWQADVTLGHTCQYSRLRGSNPSLVLLEWAGLSSPGLDLFMDVEMF